MVEFDNSVRELIHLRPRFRKDVAISVKKEGVERSFVIEDHVSGKYFRIGEPEYRFIGLLDGSVTVGQALSQVARDLGENALDEHDAAVILNWVFESGLMEPESELEANRIIEARDHRSNQKMYRWLNPLFIKVPLCNPDRFLGWCKPVAKFFLSPSAFVVWIIVVVSGLFNILANVTRFTTEASSVLAISNWVSLIVVWIAIKIIHELFHGIVCKHYGGEVNEAGVILILLAPIGYVDATSSWRFSSRWQRMFTAAAGIYAELFLAAVAAWLWAGSEPGMFRDVCYNIIIIASINTLVFNANPLMKFDGYYILSDLVNIPNLYVEGRTYVKYLGRKYLLGVPTQFPVRTFKDAAVVKIYGILSFLWRILVVVTLIIAASVLFHGLGLILAIFAVCVIVVIPGAKFLHYLFAGNDIEKPNALKFITIVSLLSIVGYFGFFRFEWNQTVSVHGMVEFDSVKEYRTVYPATVEAVHVEDGESVSAGQKLVSLSNPELQLAVGQLRIDLMKIELERKRMLDEGKVADYQASKEQEVAVEQQLLQSEQILDELEVTAESDGIAIMQSPGYLLGRYVDNSDVLVSIAQSYERELRLALPQREINRIEVDVDDQIQFYLPGRKAVNAVVHTITPSASDALLNPALSAIGGGGLPVISDGAGDFRFTEPYFWIFANVAEGIGSGLGAGERGMARLGGAPTSLGYLWVRAVRDWAGRIIGHLVRK